MIKTILIIVIVVAIIFFPPLRTFLLSAPTSVISFFKDMFNNFKHHSWNIAPYGFIDCYCAEFGGGKTLSATSRVVKLYEKYNDKKVYHPELKRMVTQKIQILSNVDLKTVPYIPLKSMEQFIKACEVKAENDRENNTLTVTYLIGDEFSSQMNSRNFKSNIPSALLNKILTSRHYFASWFITSQRFNQIDKLIRDSTRFVYECSKTWRFLFQDKFNAWELENCNNPTILEPVDSQCKFVYDKMYNQYNTYACVENLSDDWKSGNYLSDAEVLQLRQPTVSDSGSVHLRKKFIRKNRK